MKTTHHNYVNRVLHFLSLSNIGVNTQASILSHYTDLCQNRGLSPYIAAKKLAEILEGLAEVHHRG
jgi:hypothetical protein